MTFSCLKKRWAFLLLPAVLLLCSLGLVGCSDDDTVDTATKATILVTHDINGRALGDDVKTMTFYCYNRNGIRTFGPASVSKAHQILLQAVPIDSISLSIAYYNDDKKIIGYYSQPIALKIGETTEITDPAWEDVASISNLKAITLATDEMRIHTGNNANCLAFGLFTDADDNSYLQLISPLCTWTSSNEAVATNKKEDGELDESLSPGVFSTKTTGKTVLSCEINGLSESCDLEVTDATVAKAELSVEELQYPFCRDFVPIDFTVTWSDGVKSDVAEYSSWTSGDTSVLTAACGVLRARALSTSSISVSASFKCGTETYSDSCLVDIVDATFDSVVMVLDTAEIAVGDYCTPDVYGHYLLSDGKAIPDLMLDGSEYTLSSSNTAVANVEDSFSLKGLIPGTTTVKAVSVENPKLKDEAELTVVEY